MSIKRTRSSAAMVILDRRKTVLLPYVVFIMFGAPLHLLDPRPQSSDMFRHGASFLTIAAALPTAGSNPTTPSLNQTADMDIFINGVRSKLQAISDQARQNDAETCTSVQNCHSSCSRSSCSYIGNENFDCMDGFSSTQGVCYDNISDTTSCSTMKVSFAYPFIRLPNMSRLMYSDKAKRDVFQAVCINKPLDGTFQRVLTQDDFKRGGSLYYGDMLGTTRIFPGSQMDGTNPEACTEYDPRQRPWFPISPAKDVVIVVDLGQQMSVKGPYSQGFEKISRIDRVKEIVLLLLQTLRTDRDRVGIVTFPPVLPASYIPLDNILDLNKPQGHMNKSKAFVANMTPGSQDSFLEDGIDAGLRMLESSMQSNRESVLLTFTTGNIGPGLNASSVSDKIKQHRNTYAATIKPGSPRVFLYGVDISVDSFEAQQNLDIIAKEVDGFAAVMGNSDPLLGIYTYFDFLARFYYNNTDPLQVADAYVDFSSLGYVATLVQPVYRYDSHFLGVVGMDIRNDSNTSATFSAVISNIKVVVRNISSLRDALGLTNVSVLGMDGFPSQNCTTSPVLYSADVFCKSNESWPPLEQLKCCNNCLIASSSSSPPSFATPATSNAPQGSNPQPHNSKKDRPVMAIIIGVVVGAVVLVVLSGIGWKCSKRKSSGGRSVDAQPSLSALPKVLAPLSK